MRFATTYSYALCVSLALQAGCLALYAKHFLEFTDRMFCLAFGFYWLGFLAAVLPRHKSPSTWRLAYVSFGFLAWFLAAVNLLPSASRR